MKFQERHVYHVFNQGNNRQEIFKTDEDYIYFLWLAKSYVTPYADFLAWSLLPNHFHFMIHANEQSVIPHKQGGIYIDKLTNGIRKLLSVYSHNFNSRNGRTGSLFRQKTKAKDLSNFKFQEFDNRKDSYLNCFYYVHQNAYRHGLVKDLRNWKYSSFHYYINATGNDFCNKELAREICDYDEGTFLLNVYSRIPDSLQQVYNMDT